MITLRREIVWIVDCVDNTCDTGTKPQPFKHNLGATMKAARSGHSVLFCFQLFQTSGHFIASLKIVFSSFQNEKSLLYGTEPTVNNVNYVQCTLLVTCRDNGPNGSWFESTLVLATFLVK